MCLVLARNAHYICIIKQPGGPCHDDEGDDADADLHHLPGLHDDPGGSKQVSAGGR